MLRFGCLVALGLMLLSATAAGWADGDSGDDGGDGCYGGFGTPQETIAACTPLIASAKDAAILPLHLSARASAYEQIGDYDRALADLDRAVELNPDDPDAYRDRARVRIQKEDFSGALADAETLIRLRPEDPYSYAYRGWANMIIGDYDTALIDLDHAIRMGEPGSWWTHVTRGKVFLLKGKFDEALMDYDSALALAPGHAAIEIDRGIARLVARNDRMALLLNDDFEAALKRDPTNAYALLWTLATEPLGMSDTDRRLASYRSSVRPDAWPGPIIAFYLGLATVNRVGAAAEAGGKDVGRRRCEAAFFIGMYDLRNRAAEAARYRLSEAQDICPNYSGESLVAKAKLGQM